MPWPTRALHPPGKWAQPISKFKENPPSEPEGWRRKHFGLNCEIWDESPEQHGG